MLVPSSGRCWMPLTKLGAVMPAASRMVGSMSMKWLNWLRMPPTSLIRAGQDMTMPCRVPPKCEAICFVHLNGVSKAQVQPTAICG